MVRYIEFNSKLKSILDEEEVRLNVKMKDCTSFKVGGPADIFVMPNTYEKVREVINVCKVNKVPYFILGKGSNLLVKDGGIRGVVINLSKLDEIKVEEDKVIAQSGAVLSKVTEAALETSLTGLEFANGIPGSVGGAVTMNAGAYNGEISQVIESALVVDNKGEIRRLSKEELELSYRMSAILKYEYVVLEATFKLLKGDYSTIKARMDDLMRRRREKQPLEYPSAGSTFKRPEGYFAGKLIEDSGLKGTRVGGAEVSVKHSGFIINKESASAKEILDLIKLVQATVKEKFNVELSTEVRIIGEEETE
ncbi:UDP-N-acetylmuramate dehydrogenase [Clostridium bovifaecis]|uniref:UDP-N-acetylenolpyruvoylglucosamine reductase n=1 Tax=Clostridium bovifaecis TaxID=2184719 RepID=A0A6I6ER41_9CLOT|nr:UDP-N-acetylmuramate dehydrogenase [Clostridium bovifaecis]